MKTEAPGKLRFHLVEDCFGAKIRVIGIGGGGGNALNRMIAAGIEGVDFIAVNTDLQALNGSKAPTRIQIGHETMRGLGSGGRPEAGKQAAMEDTEKLIEILEGSDMVFLTAGLGGGTGTGATPIIANLAAELDILAIAICTLPFEFEGRVRAKQAHEGLAELKNAVDTVIAIPNERLLQAVAQGTYVEDGFKVADDILRQAVQGVSDLITKPGLINLDFADVKSIMKGMGMAYMGMGIAAGENRAAEAANKAICSPLLIDTSIEGARGVLINITGGKDLTLHEVSKASQLVHKLAHPEANIIFGTVIDPSMKDQVKVTVIATGFDQADAALDDLEEFAARYQGQGQGRAVVHYRKTPPPVPVRNETPPFPFDRVQDRVRPERPAFRAETPFELPDDPRPRPSATASVPAWDKGWEEFEKPSFIRQKHSQVRKYPS
ncbi:MAG: cell division protein FtsZ [Candidatus Aminicenantes bacterium]|nr:cell division protein FtsZ [Candidatus Aminicenantes bacterium]